MNSAKVKMDREKKKKGAAALRLAGFDQAEISAALAAAAGRNAEPGALRPVAVRQARVCELLDCSRFHVRKLERLGLLKSVDIAGLKRYSMTEVIKLIGGAL